MQSLGRYKYCTHKINDPRYSFVDVYTIQEIINLNEVQEDLVLESYDVDYNETDPDVINMFMILIKYGVVGLYGSVCSLIQNYNVKTLIDYNKNKVLYDELYLMEIEYLIRYPELHDTLRDAIDEIYDHRGNISFDSLYEIYLEEKNNA